MNETTPLLSLNFSDGSRFDLPPKWNEAIAERYGALPDYDQISDDLALVTQKYVEHQAWPSKYDGLQYPEEEGPQLLDRDNFYWEPWADWPAEGREWSGGYISNPPTHAQVAEGVMYQQLRIHLMQQSLRQSGSSARVVTVEQALQELGANKDPDKEADGD